MFIRGQKRPPHVYLSYGVLLCATLLGGALSAKGVDKKGKDAESDLARVGIARFANADKNVNYEWVEESLPDAISTSMREKFEFIAQDSAHVNSAFQTYFQSGKSFSTATAVQIAAASQSDILIIGDFSIDNEKSEIVMRASIFNATAGQFIGKVEEKSQVSNRIFTEIDKMAASIVAEIYQYALQANQNAGKEDLKLLVLVPSFSTAEERVQAEKELVVLKTELARKTPGNYITIFEFFEKYKVAEIEQEGALKLARAKNRSKIKVWLYNYGVTDAFLVFVSNNKVNITAVSETKTAQVSYSVGATEEEKQKAIAQAQEAVQGKTALIKDDGRHSFVLFHVGVGASKGALTAGEKFGMLLNPMVHVSFRFWKYFEPQVRFEGYYSPSSQNQPSIVGASGLAGLGYSVDIGRWNFATYAAGGIYSARVDASWGGITVLLPAASGGFFVTWFISPRFGLSLGASAQYLFDPSASGLFATATLASVVRF